MTALSLTHSNISIFNHVFSLQDINKISLFFLQSMSDSHKDIEPHDIQLKITPSSSDNEAAKGFKSTMDKVNFLSKANFLYVLPLIFQGWKTNKANIDLTENDMVTFPRSNRGDVLEAGFVNHLKGQKKANPNRSANTALAVFMTVKWKLLLAATFHLIFVFNKIFMSWVMKRLIENYMDPRYATTHSYWWAAILAASMLFGFYFDHHWVFRIFCLSNYVRAGVISMLHTKITKLSVHSITKISPGKLLNLATNDVNFFEAYGVFSVSLISGWPILIACSALLWTYFGVTCLLGMGYLVAIVPVAALIAKASIKPKQDRNIFTDDRIKKLTEAIDGIRLLKMYTWETKFMETIANLRKKDVRMTKKVLFWSEVLIRGLTWSPQYMASFLMFMLYYVTGGELTIAKVFSGYSLMMFIRIHFVFFQANLFNFLIEARLFFQRVDKVMDAPEMNEIVFDKPLNMENSAEFDNYTGYWGTEQQQDTPNPMSSRSALENINLNLKKKSLNAVVGPVGSGKTSFLLAFTGEIPQNTGNIRFKGRIAYVEQEPTIFAGTIRESILFGNKYNEEFYKKVIKACNLESDLKLFPQDDMTNIEERGTNLSGGQRARLALARAVYADADIYLLDDPLSAVDAKVAKSIYTEAISGLLKEKTVILVTHQVYFVRDVPNIIVMEHGKVLGNGTYEELRQKGVDVDRIFSTEHHHKNEQITPQQETPQQVPATTAVDDFNNNDFYEDNQEGAPKSTDIDPYAGKVTFKTYSLLFKEVGWRYLSAIVVVYILLQFGDVAFGRILGAWIAEEFNLGTSLGALGGISIAMIFIYVIKNIFFTFGFLRASRRYHKKLLEKVMRSPVSFFDTNPVGRILGRFSGGIGILDRFFPVVGIDVFDIGSAFIAVVITLAILDPIYLGPLVGAIIIFVTVICIFYPAIRQTKNYDISTKNPLFSHFSSSISGISIIRTYGQAELVRQKFARLLQTSTKSSINFTLVSSSMGFFIDLAYVLTGIIMVYITTARIDPSQGADSGAMAGFTLALIVSLVGVFQWGVKMFCQTNVLMAAAAEVQSYCTLPSEAPLSVQSDLGLKQKGWPKTADISFNQVYMKYRPQDDHVIKNLSLIVSSGEKIGCVGRTGAGKSTIINLLFRLQEIDRTVDPNSTSLKIDNTETLSLGLHLLRGNISIIPQVPFIFTGTIRQNIDPLNQLTDEKVWSALAEVRLKEHVENLPHRLQTNMENAAAVFSVGQKQLVCLARTILRPSKILVLDEATANMDSETDAFIQKKIMEKFADSTVFTVAHRLSTIADYDRVLVLDKGTKMEYDAPYKLLAQNVGDMTLTNPNGFFGSMVMNTGLKASQRIINIAKEAYDRKNKTQGEENKS